MFKSLAQYIRGEGLELLDRPRPPKEHVQESSMHRSQSKQDEASKQKQSRNYDTDTEWLAYCDWLQGLSKQAIDQFLRGIQIGVQLDESWLVSQGCAYIWNYVHHKIEKRQFNELVPILGECLNALRRVGHNNEPELLVAISVALANGLMQSWLPPEQAKSLQIPVLVGESASANEKSTRKTNQAIVGANQQVKIQFSLSAEAQADIRKALEVKKSFPFLKKIKFRFKKNLIFHAYSSKDLRLFNEYNQWRKP